MLAPLPFEPFALVQFFTYDTLLMIYDNLYRLVSYLELTTTAANSTCPVYIFFSPLFNARRTWRNAIVRDGAGNPPQANRAVSFLQENSIADQLKYYPLAENDR